MVVVALQSSFSVCENVVNKVSKIDPDLKETRHAATRILQSYSHNMRRLLNKTVRIWSRSGPKLVTVNFQASAGRFLGAPGRVAFFCTCKPNFFDSTTQSGLLAVGFSPWRSFLQVEFGVSIYIYMMREKKNCSQQILSA